MVKQFNQAVKLPNLMARRLNRAVKLLNPMARRLNRAVKLLNLMARRLNRAVKLLNLMARRLNRAVKLLNLMARRLNRAVKLLNLMARRLNRAVKLLSPMARRLNQAVKLLSPMARRLNQAVKLLSPMARRLNRAVTHLNLMARRLNRAVKLLSPMARRLNRAVTHLNLMARRLNRAVTLLNLMARRLNQVVKLLSPMARRLNRVVKLLSPMARRLNRAVTHLNLMARRLNRAVTLLNLMARRLNRAVTLLNLMARRLNRAVTLLNLMVKHLSPTVKLLNPIIKHLNLTVKLLNPIIKHLNLTVKLLNPMVKHLNPTVKHQKTDCDISETNNGEAKIQGEASGVGGEASQTQCKAPETKGEAYAEQIKQEMVSRGQFQTEAGAIGKEMSIHESEKIKITGSLQPAASHLEKLADIVVTYHWTSPNGKIISMPMTIARQVPLKTEMDWVLFEGYTIGLAGNFELELGYRLNAEEFYSKPIAQLNVIPNQAPTDILLDGDTVAENSPPGTVIGSFTTVDSDTGEWFFYGLVDNPGGYFTIRGNELQVANGSGLDYENSENYPITVRSVDTSGNHLDKTFIIHVTDVPTVLDNLRLTNKYVLEQSLPGTAVARLITSSRERARYQYELVDDANGRFYLQDDILLVANNQALDFETQMTHDITIRSRATEIEGQIEKTFTIELVNIIDVVVTGEIRDANNLALSTTAIPTNQPVKIMIHLTPDAEHRGQEAEIIAMALHYQDQRLVDSLALNEAQQWQFWDGNLFSLPGYQRQILPEKADLLLYQDSFSDEFAKGTLKIYVGYRLIATGELVYPQEPVMKIMIR
jgi:ABC-type transporter Mla subunit MlaD